MRHAHATVLATLAASATAFTPNVAPKLVVRPTVSHAHNAHITRSTCTTATALWSSKVRTNGETATITRANGEVEEFESTETDFDLLVNKNVKGAKQDVEQDSERISLDMTRTKYTSLVKSPPDAYITFAEKGASNAHLPKRKIFHQSVLGGCYVGFGGLVSLMIAGNLGAAAAPGMVKMTFAALFPVNLLLILSTSGQLFTGNSATVAAAKFEGFVSWNNLWSSWALSLTGNIVGCILFAAATLWGQILNPGATDLVLKTCAAKCGATFIPTIVRAIMCNWMVSMAIFLAGAANDMAGKMVGIWFPISTFVGIGLEHSVANLYLLPLALMVGGGSFTWMDIIFKNLIPVVIGNAFAGSLIVAASYSYQFGRLGGLRRAIFEEKMKNIQLSLERRRRKMDTMLDVKLIGRK